MRLFHPPNPLVALGHPAEDPTPFILYSGSAAENAQQLRNYQQLRLSSLRVSYEIDNNSDAPIQEVTTGLRTLDGNEEHRFDKVPVQILKGRSRFPVEHVPVPEHLHAGMTEKDRALNFDYWARFADHEGRRWEATYNPRSGSLSYSLLSRKPWRVQFPSKATIALVLTALGVLIALATLLVQWRQGAESAGAAEPRDGTSSDNCTLTGQVFNADREPLAAAYIVARSPESPWTEFNEGLSDALATTDADGRFEGDCSKARRPFKVIVNWAMDPRIGGNCEWWLGPIVEDNGLHRVNIEIPWDVVENGAYHYADDGNCSEYFDQ